MTSATVGLSRLSLVNLLSRTVFNRFSYSSIQRPSDLIRDLSMFLSDTVEIPNVINETVSILKMVTHSNGGNLYLVDSIKNEIYFSPIGGIKESTSRLAWKIGEPGIIPAYVAETKEVAIMNDLIHDINFPNGMYAIDGSVITAVLCVPIVNLEGETFGVIELFRNNGENYDDVSCFLEYSFFSY